MKLPDAIFKNFCPVSSIAEVSARRQSVLAEESEVSKHDGNHLAADRGIKTVPMVFNSDNINHRNRASKTVIVATLSNSRNSAGLGWAGRGGNNQMSDIDFLNNPPPAAWPEPLPSPWQTGGRALSLDVEHDTFHSRCRWRSSDEMIFATLNTFNRRWGWWKDSPSSTINEFPLANEV